jgi:diamine N-acetyltransferase
MTLRLEKVAPANVADACALRVEPEQEEVVAPVVRSLAEAYAQPGVAWPRLVYDDDRLVAFVMGGFDPAGPVDYFRCGVWRLAVAAGHQRSGYGRFAVEAVCVEALPPGPEPRHRPVGPASARARGVLPAPGFHADRPDS